MATKKKTSQKPFANQRWAFFGNFAVWPTYHGGSPGEVAHRRGARVQETLDEKVDVVVFGDLSGTGRAEAKKKAEKLVAAGGKKPKLTILDEASYRSMVAIDLKGKRFAFVGGFDFSPEGPELLVKMARPPERAPERSTKTSITWWWSRRGPSKVALQNKAAKLVEEGAEIVLTRRGRISRAGARRQAKKARRAVGSTSLLRESALRLHGSEAHRPCARHAAQRSLQALQQSRRRASRRSGPQSDRRGLRVRELAQARRNLRLRGAEPVSLHGPAGRGLQAPTGVGDRPGAHGTGALPIRRCSG